MKSWKNIEKALNEELPPEVIESPNQRAGIYGNWVRGHTIMQLANSVFGADGWSSNIVSPPKVEEKVVSIHQSGSERRGLAVTVIVQITGHGLDENGNEVTITKTDMGWGTAAESYNRQAGRYDPLKPQQYRPAILGAITIGFKRCLSQFGRKLGMQLYIPDEDQMAMGWEESEAPATESRQTQSSVQRQPETERPYPILPHEEPPPPSAGAAAVILPTVDKLAKAMDIEVTEANRATLIDLAAKELKLAKAGKTVVRLKEVKKQLGVESAAVATVYAKMPDYGMWMVSEVAKGGSVSQAFQDMGAYDQLLRQTLDIRYMLQGGTYEPWPKADIHNPTVMVGYQIETAALRAMKDGLIERFPSKDEQDCSPYHLKAHLKQHFNIERIGVLTWEELAAFRLHVMEGTPYPERWSGGDEAEEMAEFDEGKAGTVEPALPEPEPAAVPADDTDYSGQCTKLLTEIQSQIEYEGDLVAFATKKANLSSANAHNVVKGIHAAVASGNLKDAKAVQTLLTTALKGLTK